jgi:hypothetical protein
MSLGRFIGWCAFAGAGIFVAAAQPAAAQLSGVDFGLGVSTLSFDGDDRLDGERTLGVQFGLTTMPREYEGLKLGLHFGASSYTQDARFVLPPQPELFTITGTFSDLDLMVPEVRVAWVQPVGDWFVEPSIGVAVIFGRYTAGVTRLGLLGRFDDVTIRRNRTGLGVRPGVRAGYLMRDWALGVETSYLIGRLRFGDGIGGTIGEWYIGGFVTWYF